MGPKRLLAGESFLSALALLVFRAGESEALEGDLAGDFFALRVLRAGESTAGLFLAPRVLRAGELALAAASAGDDLAGDFLERLVGDLAGEEASFLAMRVFLAGESMDTSSSKDLDGASENSFRADSVVDAPFSEATASTTTSFLSASSTPLLGNPLEPKAGRDIRNTLFFFRSAFSFFKLAVSIRILDMSPILLRRDGSFFLPETKDGEGQRLDLVAESLLLLVVVVTLAAVVTFDGAGLVNAIGVLLPTPPISKMASKSFPLAVLSTNDSCPFLLSSSSAPLSSSII
mmetsp:Transcript_18558/g.40166  ORF Transcript_18558/g.40166 Transcript_18558/m.40166 type:complete len:289 (-) Transcript_18558:432-1298(-)